MRAAQHTEAMILWWKRARVDRADLAARRPSGSMIWHHDLALDALPLAWARAENARQADIYIRPARGYDWPMVFLDDVPVDSALRVTHRYNAMVVQTSSVGGCHIWLLCDRALAEPVRKQAQRWLSDKLGADPGSVSGEHLGRLAGFRNWKRAGCWVNVLAAPSPWDPSTALSQTEPTSHPTRLAIHGPVPRDTSPSGREWGWACGMLEAGYDSETVYLQLLEQARDRRGSDAERYARRTIENALQRVGHRPAAIGERR